MNLLRKTNLLIKITALFLAVAFAVGSVPSYAAFTPKTQTAVANPEAYNLMPVYQWHRVDSQSDLPATGVKVPVLLIYQANSNVYYGNGTKSGTCKYDGDDWDCTKSEIFPSDRKYYPDPFDNSESADTFFTLDTVTNWTMALSGSTDKKNDNPKNARFWQNGSLISGYDDWDWEGAVESAGHDQWSIMTREIKTDYSDGLGENRVRIYHEVKGTDVGFEYSGDHMFGYEDGTYHYDQFVMYWAETLYVSEITEDYTIRDGMVMNIDDGVILKEGVTLKIMPGGVLSIEGQFYNNGKIENHGTIIMQPNSCITSYMPKSSSAGAIYNTGAKVNTKADAQNNIKEKQARITNLTNEVASQTAIIKEAQEVQASQSAEKDRLLNTIPTGGTELLKITIGRLDSEEEYELLLLESKQASGATDEELQAYKAEHITPIIETRAAIYADVKKAEDTYNIAVASEAAAKLVVESNNDAIARLNSQIAELNILVNSNTNVDRYGEGSLLIMENARLGLEEDAVLTIADGASCICNGYIVSPSPMVLTSGKLQVREKGAVILEHHFTKNILNFMGAEVSGAKTLDVSFYGLDKLYNSKSGSMYVSGKYDIIVDGILKYHTHPVYDTTRNEGILVSKGKGAWSTAGTYNYELGPDGSIIEIDAQGNRYSTAADGTVTYYDVRTCIITTYMPDGTYSVDVIGGMKTVYYPNNGGYSQYRGNWLRYEERHTDTYDSKLSYDTSTLESVNKVVYKKVGPLGEKMRLVYLSKDPVYFEVFSTTSEAFNVGDKRTAYIEKDNGFEKYYDMEYFSDSGQTYIIIDYGDKKDIYLPIAADRDFFLKKFNLDVMNDTSFERFMDQSWWKGTLK